MCIRDSINGRLTELLASRDADGDLLREKIRSIIPEFVLDEVRRPLTSPAEALAKVGDR